MKYPQFSLQPRVLHHECPRTQTSIRSNGSFILMNGVRRIDRLLMIAVCLRLAMARPVRRYRR